MQNEISEWIKEPFSSFIEEMNIIGSSAFLMSLGFTILTINPSIIGERIPKFDTDPVSIKIHDTVIESLYNGKAFESIQKQLVIGLWSSLEAFIYDFLVQWMKHNPSYLQKEKIGKIKISLAEYVQMNEDERIYYLLEQLKQELNTSLKQGAGAFETLLNQFDLGGPIDEEVRKILLEISNVRNIIVHRQGIVDKRFVKSCPWLEVQVGDTFIVEPEKFGTYSHAVSKYIEIIFMRLKKYFEEK